MVLVPLNVPNYVHKVIHSQNVWRTAAVYWSTVLHSDKEKPDLLQPGHC